MLGSYGGGTEARLSRRGPSSGLVACSFSRRFGTVMLGFSANTIWFPGLSWQRDWSMAKISLYCNTYTRYEDEYRHARMIGRKRNSLSLPLVHPNSEWDVGL